MPLPGVLSVLRPYHGEGRTIQFQRIPIGAKRDPLAPRSTFYRRLSYNVVAGSGLILVSLAIGVAGYAGFAGLGPVDAFLNAAMILGGMGPVDTLTSDAAKIFAGIYAIYSGVTIMLTATVAMIAGGLGSLSGAFVLAIAISVLQNVSLIFIPGVWSLGVTFLIFVIFMLFRPKGLFAS